MNDKKSKWDEIRQTGILIFILSLPVMVWRSGHFGKVISLIVMGLALIFLGGKISDMFFNINNRWEIRNESDRTLADIHKTKENVGRIGVLLGGIDAYCRHQAEGKAQEIVDKYKDELAHLEDKITEIQSSIAVIKDSEQAGIKQRIIELNEEVKLNKKSIDSKEIRTKFEDVFKNMSLLSADDKDRFMHDLKEMGFYLEQSENQVRAYRGGVTFTSKDVVTVGAYPAFRSRQILARSASMDMTFVGNSGLDNGDNS